MSDVSTADFGGFTTRDELSTFVANAAVTGAPFARSITPLPTNRGGVTFPTADPTGFDWVTEGGAIPDVDLQDGSYTAAIAKLAGILTMSSEFIDDNELPISGLLGDAVADAMGPKLDQGLLYGGGSPEPDGILAQAALGTAADDLRDAVIAAWGDLVGAGGGNTSGMADATEQDPMMTPIMAFAAPSIVALEMARLDAEGRPIYPPGAYPVIGPGIRLIPVVSLNAADVLVADTSRLYLVLRQDFEAAISGDAKFVNDQTVMRIKGRFAVAGPTPTKTIRRANFPTGS